MASEHIIGSVIIFTLSLVTIAVHTFIYHSYLQRHPPSVVGLNQKIYVRKLTDEQVDMKLQTNSFYKQFDINKRQQKTQANLLLIVSSAPARFDRRKTIRDTWWTECKTNFKKTVRCIFMTDNVTREHKHYKQVQNEISEYNDVELQNLRGGVQFGVRMIYHMLYAFLNYNFDYFLRLDDDYFVCANKLIYELPIPPITRFHWGWVHKDGPGMQRRAEESVFLVSRDVIETFLTQNASSMICHPWADQMIILWSDNLDLRHMYRHDDRLYHYIDKKNKKRIETELEICQHFIGVHGAYPASMLDLWKRKGNRTPYQGDLYSNSFAVTIDENFCWKCIGHPWQYEPKLCSENPSWDTSRQGKDSYAGESGKI